MTRLFNNPNDFVDEMIDGFVAAHSNEVRRVWGGVISTTEKEEGVAIVVGGGAGHYPAFGGLVGPGMADAAVLGNVFASPSSRQVQSVVSSVQRNDGVLLAYGNYAGDVLHFTDAQSTLREAGIDCRSIAVTDDIFSAPKDEIGKRRGIAGDLMVVKIAGAAAAAGANLDDVERMANLANARTRSMGVAFSGCTLPGATEPLFQVDQGMMAIGLGIHGEPGFDTVPLPTADELADLFVARLLDEVPPGVELAGARVVPLLNGLGTVKREELFVVYRRVAEALTERGLIIVAPRVGEYCTSFDMAGASLSLLWLDGELEELWLASATAPGFHSNSWSEVAAAALLTPTDGPEAVPIASAESTESAAQGLAAIRAIADVVDEHVALLGELDSVAGDGDHGIGMQRGSRAAAESAQHSLASGAGIRTLLERAADDWADAAGGTSGALWAVILRSIAAQSSDQSALTGPSLVAGISGASEAIMSFGKAAVGDKTMVDAVVPFADTLRERAADGDNLHAAWQAAAVVSTAAADATSTLVPRMGRSRAHGENAVGAPDPGAVSFALIAHAVGESLTASPQERDEK